MCTKVLDESFCSETNRQRGVTVRPSLTFWIGKVDELHDWGLGSRLVARLVTVVLSVCAGARGGERAKPMEAAQATCF